MRVVPELGGDEELRAGDVGLADGLANLLLVAVDPSTVNVAVSGLESDLDGVLDDVRLGLPGAQSK